MFKPDGDSMRRVVPSPTPQRIFEHRPIRWLLDQGCVVICAGGGGIPTCYGGRPSAARCRSGHRQGPRERPARTRHRCRHADHGDRRAGRLRRRSAQPDQRAIAQRASGRARRAARRVRRRIDAPEDDRRVRLRARDRQAGGDRRAHRHRSDARRHGGHACHDRARRRRPTPTRDTRRQQWRWVCTPKSASCARSWCTGRAWSTAGSRRRTRKSCCSTTCCG